MKNIFLVLLILPLGLYSETIQLSSPQTGMLLNYSDFNQINLTCEFNQVNIDQIQQGYQIFNTVSVPRIHSSMAVGSPRLPVMRKVIEIPAGAQVEIEANAVVDQKLYITNMLYPVQPPLEKIQGNQPEFIINMDAYSQGNVYGEQPVIITDQGYIRGHHFVTVDIYPIRYQPDIGELEIRSRIEVNLYLTGSNPAVTAENYRKYNSQQTSAFMEEILVNANAYDFNENPQLPCGFLIIAPDAYISNLTDFVQWKREKGYQVTVTATSQTGTSTTQIKNYLQDAYDNWAVPPQFVIFVGDNNHIPGYTGQETNVISDHPYTQLDGTDLFPDIWLGRLSVSSSAELDSILDKILYYEQPDLWTAGNAWCKKAVFMASSDNHNVSEGSHRWVIQTYLGPDGYSCDSLWYYYGATTGQVSNAFNDGRSWGIYSGHGSTTSWADGPPFSQSNVNALTNEGMYPVVMSYACNTGQFSVSECFAETWIRAGNKGAVSFWGSSPSSYWTEDDTLERWVFQAIYDSSITWQKGFYDYGLFGVYTYGGTYASPQYYYEAYHLFGDPSMDAWTGYPQQAVVNYPSAVPIGSVNVQVNVSTSKAPVENALVAISDQDSLWTGYTNSTGVANIMVNTIQAGSLNVVVTAHNLQPHRGTIYITSNNAYVSYLMLNPTGGHNNGQINAGCNYDLEVYVKNWGNQTAHNCYGILSSTDPNINITEDSVYYGDINPSDSTSGNGLFAVDIASSIPDGYSIPCNLTITAAESTWVSNVGITVSAPLLVLDAVGGPDQVLPGDNF
ncbi:MAG: C25 family cysteine peptidase, partial [bacterium]